MTPLREREATEEQLLRELPERLAPFKEQRFPVIVTPLDPAIAPEKTGTPRKRTITEILVEMAKEAPEEERAKTPPDLTDNPDNRAVKPVVEADKANKGKTFAPNADCPLRPLRYNGKVFDRAERPETARYNCYRRNSMTPLLEMEATAEQIAQELPARLAKFAGQRFHVVVTPAEAGGTTETPRKKTITEIVVEMGLEAPEEERAKIPPDLTDNLDHYIYGWPRK